MCYRVSKCCFKRRLRCWSGCCVVSFLLTVFFSLAVGLALADEIMFLFVKKDLQLVPGSETLDDWLTPADAGQIYDIFYVFDTQNPDEYAAGEVPVVKEVGPFAYKRHDNKFNVTWNSDETLITFHRDIYYVFDPDKSVGDPHDYSITVINVPLIAVLDQLPADNLLPPIRSALTQTYLRLLDKQSLFLELTAQEVLWGYDPTMSLTDSAVLVAAKTNHSSNFTEGFTTADTGKDDIYNVAQLVRWNNLTSIAVWNSEDARHLYGTLGLRFRPRLEKSRVTVYSDDFVRHVSLAYGGDAELRGIDLYRYKLTHHLFSNVSQFPLNEGYYAYDYNYGMINLSIIYGIPLYNSNPHCLGCDPEYFKTVSGYYPTRSKHESYVDIEPFTGVVLHGAARSQANVRVKKNEHFRQVRSVQFLTMYPWFYQSTEATASESSTDDFKNRVQLPRTILNILVIICLVLSGLTMLLMAVLLYYHKREESKTSYNSSINEDNDYSSSPLLKSNNTNYNTMEESIV
ncbi:lysosome membrane protein 2-like [Dysidea avara]|uniref:lysosome membrane protein 2-like n=1 Tax=Dysidea avara TaxID=196820 RepID=UPI00331818D1